MSLDGVNWARASSFPELFAAEIIETPGLDHLAANYGTTSGKDGGYTIAPASLPSGGQPGWYYTSGGKEQGPVEFSNLQLLAASGQLGPQDLVWSSGMSAWTAASQVPGLNREASSAGLDADRATGKDKYETLSPKLSLAAQGSRPWAYFLAITGFIFAAVQVAGGILFLILGAQRGPVGGGVIFTGLMYFVGAAVTAAGAALLMTYASRLGDLAHSSNPRFLEEALNALRSFWLYASIVTIVWLAFVVVFVILVFAHAVSLPPLHFTG